MFCPIMSLLALALQIVRLRRKAFNVRKTFINLRFHIFEVYGTSESGVNDERSDKKGRRCRIVVVVT